MFKYCTLCFLLFQFLHPFAQTADSLKTFNLKGIDVSIGGCSFDFGNKASVNSLVQLSPESVRSRYKYNEAIARNTYIRVIRINLGIVFGNKRPPMTGFLKRKEAVFRFAFESGQQSQFIDSVTRNISWARVTEYARFYYTYQTQTVGLGYQISTRTLAKAFALYGGVNVDFGMLTLKQIRDFEYTNTNNLEISNFNTTMARGHAQLGIKYNFTCDINFFLYGESGGFITGKTLGASIPYGGFAFGIRYKFLEDQDKKNYRNNGFW